MTVKGELVQQCKSFSYSYSMLLCRSIRRSVPSFFQLTNMVAFKDKKSLNDITNNDTMSDDEGVSTYVPPRYSFALNPTGAP